MYWKSEYSPPAREELGTSSTAEDRARIGSLEVPHLALGTISWTPEAEQKGFRPGDRLDGVPIVILINEGTASAAEIVAGALQDRERAELIGMTSFGKGSIQTIIPLRGGRDGALRLTTGRYYTPAGRSIQATGIIPDLQISSWELEDSDPEHSAPQVSSEADLPGALENENGEHRADTDVAAVEQPPADWPEDEDYQLSRAREVLRSMMESQQAALQ